MIYTLTLNPSVDYIITMDEVKLGELNRVNDDSKFPGGKGINVSRLLKKMGVTSKAIGYLGGFTGKYIEDYLHAEDIETAFIQVEDDTRINVKIKSMNETELNGRGPEISEDKFNELKKAIAALTNEDLLVIAGSIPSSMPETTYEQLVQQLAGQGTSFVVDAEGELLKKVLPYRPFLIKPNHHELGELFGKTFSSAEEVIPYGKKLIEMGAENVIVSLAAKGAVLITKGASYISSVPKGEVKSSVGAGDSMVAGFLAEYNISNDLEAAFRFSVACGSATAFSMGLCTREKAEALLNEVKINKY